MPVDPKLHLDANIPWSEPAWLRGVPSPYYNESHRTLQRRVRAYVDAHILPHALDWEAAGEAPAEAARRFCASGIPFADIPAPYRPGGVPDLAGVPQAQLDAFHLLVLSDEMARVEGGVGIALAGASAIGAPPIVSVGTEDQKRRWLPGLFARETSFSLGVTEPSGGSDVARLATTAERTPDGSAYVVNGVKKWITGTPWATHMTTAVRTRTTTTAGPRRPSSPEESMGRGSSGESMGKGGSTTTTTGDSTRDGISLLVIPMDAAGVVHQKIHNSGQNAGGASYVYLENVRVPADHLLGRENDGFRVVMQNFNRERFLLTVACNRKARSCLAMALQYATRRETFGRPLVRNQVIRRKLAELAHRIEAHWAWLEQLAYQVSSSASGPRGGGWDDAAIASTVALLKVQGGQLIELAAREAAQVFGGAAYQKAGPGAAVEQINRDLRMLVSRHTGVIVVVVVVEHVHVIKPLSTPFSRPRSSFVSRLHVSLHCFRGFFPKDSTPSFPSNPPPPFFRFPCLFTPSPLCSSFRLLSQHADRRHMCMRGLSGRRGRQRGNHRRPGRALGARHDGRPRGTQAMIYIRSSTVTMSKEEPESGMHLPRAPVSRNVGRNKEKQETMGLGERKGGED